MISAITYISIEPQSAWLWDQPHTYAFSSVKHLQTGVPILTFYGPPTQTVVIANASGFDVDAAFFQQDGGKLKPIAYYCRTLTGAKQIEKES